MLTDIRTFAIALLIGLIIGIERERSHPEGQQAMGVRTFILIALLGAIAAFTEPLKVSLIISIFTFSGILLGYLRSTKIHRKVTNIGLTTELSAGIVFSLGYLTHQEPLLALLLSSIVLLILSERQLIHKFSRAHITSSEIQATGIVILIILVAVLLLPNRTLDHWHLFNPQYFGIIVALIAGLQFFGYLVIKLFGNRLGMSLMGFFGGLISSTAVFGTLPKLVKEQHDDLSGPLSTAVWATIAKMLQLLFIISLISYPLFKELIYPVGGAIIAGICVALFTSRKNNPGLIYNTARNPLDYKAIFYLSLFISAIFILSTIAKRYFGAEALQAISFFGGLVELHGTAIVSASFFDQHKISLTIAEVNILVALIGSFVTKFILLWSTMHNSFRLICSLALIIIMAGGALGYELKYFI